MQWLAGLLLLVVLAQSGGFFVHLGIGQAGRRSAGTVLTRTGALIARPALAAGRRADLHRLTARQAGHQYPCGPWPTP